MHKLPAHLTISHVEECKTELLQLIADNKVSSFDDRYVTSIDTVGVQLLLTAVTYISAQKKELKWNSSSSVIQESVKQLGIDEAILNQYLNA